MRKIDSLLERIYEKNSLNGNYIIEVSLNNYAGIFNDWDHAPYKRKDIDPELITFIQESIDDIPLEYNVDICFYFSEEEKNQEREKIIVSRLRTYYTIYIEIKKNKIKSILKNAIIYMLISAVLLTSSYFGVLYRDNIVFYTLTEIIIVGGWVFLWEAISLLMFEKRKVSILINNYKRFIVDISFRYKKLPEE